MLNPVPVTQRSTLPFPGVSAGFASPPRTLLLVEDSRLAAEAVRLMCRRAGIRLRRAETLEQAASHLKVYRPDITLVDLGLPDGSGLGLISQLSHSREKTARVVAVSGDASLEHAAMQAGADAFLLKPVSMADHLCALTGTPPNLDVDLHAMDRSLGLNAGRLRTDRNQGADPLALCDDLRRVRTLLLCAEDRERVRYAGQFLASVGRSLHDEQLARAAEIAGSKGDRRALIALLDTREPMASPL